MGRGCPLTQRLGGLVRVLLLFVATAWFLGACNPAPAPTESPSPEPAPWVDGRSDPGDAPAAAPGDAEPRPAVAPARHPAQPVSEPPPPAEEPGAGHVAAMAAAEFAAFAAANAPNEVGVVPILLYHNFGAAEERWTRRWDNFRRDLQTLYDMGFRAVNLQDYLAGNMALPAGASPVIFTFDDGSASQFALRRQADGSLAVDPQSAVGVLLDFARTHPDFGVAGTFYINIIPEPFAGDVDWPERVRFLVDLGFEVGNHAYNHENLGQLDAAGAARALARTQAAVAEAVPGYSLGSLALPFGIWPQDRSIAFAGEAEGVTYRHEAVLLVGADPAPSPFAADFGPVLPRIQAIDSEFERWLGHLATARYISDGDPATLTVPAHLADRVAAAALEGRVLRVYAPD